MPELSADERLAIDNCEREPIHIPGVIQDFGMVLVFDRKQESLIGYSQNANHMLPTDVQKQAASLSSLLGRKIAHEIRNVLGLNTIHAQRERIDSTLLNGVSTDVSVYVHEDRFVVELEPADHSERFGSALNRVRQMLSGTATARTAEELLKSGVQQLRQATGYDRVMAYQFLENGDGEVVAEAVGPGVGQFLGLRYPASDIPRQARQIALQATVRMIADIKAAPIPMVLLDSSAKPVNLTLCQLRGVSPIHVEYLRNMGVRATMSIAMICRGELWGLFACHHYQPNRLSVDTRAVCELFGQYFSLSLQNLTEQGLATTRRRARSAEDSLRQQAQSQDGLKGFLEPLTSLLPSIIACDGIAIVDKTEIQFSGDCLKPDAIRRLIRISDDDLYAIDSLESVDADFTESLKQTSPDDTPNQQPAGALVLKISDQSDCSVILFRNEIIQQVRWGGMPKKTIDYGPNGPRLHPRASFDEYTESVEGTCPPWTMDDITAATEMRSMLIESLLRSINQTTELRTVQHRQKDLLIAELNHRVKNILALVQSVARQTMDSTDSLDLYAVALQNRISALATAHDLIGFSGAQWASVSKLLTNELQPYANRSEGDVVLNGPVKGLRADVAPIVALVIHELVSNAAKHGSLSTSAGRVVVNWFERDGGLAIHWREQGGPLVSPPSRTGFGKTLIDQAIPYECEGEVEQRFSPGGVEVDLWLPNEAVSNLDHHPSTGHFSNSATAPKKHSIADQPATALSAVPSGRVLVVEDNLLLANEFQRLLLELGFDQIDTAPSVRQAQKHLEQNDYVLAIMDINLGTETSFAAAISAKKKGVPLLFSTGYDASTELPTALLGTTIMSKPVNPQELISQIACLNLTKP